MRHFKSVLLIMWCPSTVRVHGWRKENKPDPDYHNNAGWLAGWRIGELNLTWLYSETAV